MSKKVRILLSDCPWEYADRREHRKDNPNGKTKFGIGAQGNYAMGTQKLSYLQSLGPLVKAVCADDAYCFMWATLPNLPDAINLMPYWGFEYVTTPKVWVKTYPKSGEPFKGPGRYTQSNAELLLLGRRPKTKCWHTNKGWRPAQIEIEESTVVFETHPRNDEGKIIHSKKPAVFQEQLEQWLGDQLEGFQMMELFAREQRPGWVCFGGDISGRDISEDLKEYGLSCI